MMTGLGRGFRNLLSRPSSTIRLGSGYGGWHVPTDIRLTEESVCYLVGAGEDISFDVELVRRFKSSVLIVDPTPRAKQHYLELISATERGIPFAVNRSNRHFYSITLEDCRRMSFLNLGISDKDGLERFYFPKNPEHVSCSIRNLQATQEFFEAKCVTVSTLMSMNAHLSIDLLKLDIEGAEHGVIHSMLTDGVRPKYLLVEFDDDDSTRMRETLSALRRSSYKCLFVEGRNYTFLRSNILG